MHDTLYVSAMSAEAEAFIDQRCLITGPGKVAATLGLAQLFGYDSQPHGQYMPKQVIVIGTAASLRGETGIVEPSRVWEHDFDRVSLTQLSPGKAIDYNPPIDLAGNGGNLVTGDQFVTDPHYAERLRFHGADYVDMEGYAYAAVCRLYRVPLRIIKYLSDDANSSSVNKWRSEVRNASFSMRNYLKQNS